LKIDLPCQGANPWAIAVIGVPKDYDPTKQAWPVVFSLHGTDDTPDASVTHSRLVLEHGCFLIAPRTLHKLDFWYHPNDRENLDRILGHLADHYRIDPRRIVLTGGSGGGMGTWGLTLLDPELYCAAASHSGMPPAAPRPSAGCGPSGFSSCTGSRTTSRSHKLVLICPPGSGKTVARGVSDDPPPCRAARHQSWLTPVTWSTATAEGSACLT